MYAVLVVKIHLLTFEKSGLCNGLNFTYTKMADEDMLSCVQCALKKHAIYLNYWKPFYILISVDVHVKFKFQTVSRYYFQY